MPDRPGFNRASLRFGARRLATGISVVAHFKAPKLSTSEAALYRLHLWIDPHTRGLLGAQFSVSRTNSKHLASHGGGKADLNYLAREVRDLVLRSPAWIKLKDREPDPYYSVNEKGDIFIQQPRGNQ